MQIPYALNSQKSANGLWVHLQQNLPETIDRQLGMNLHNGYATRKKKSGGLYQPKERSGVTDPSLCGFYICSSNGFGSFDHSTFSASWPDRTSLLPPCHVESTIRGL